MINRINQIILLAIFPLLFLGCQNSSPEVTESKSALTVGTVQKEIKNGMTQANVASVLGSPNIVTKEEADIEVWIYDKMSSTVDYQNSSSFGSLILIGSSSENGRITNSQKTLTVIIKFKKGKVYEYKYHSSTF